MRGRISLVLVGALLALGPAVAAEDGAPKPANGAWGVDLTGMDTSVRPGDDFFRYVNGKWVDRTEIPPDRLEAGGLTALQYQALDETKALLDEAAADASAPAGAETRKIADWYVSMLDEAAIEAAGFAPIKPDLDAIDAVTTTEQLIALFAAHHAGLGVKPIAIGVDFDRTRKDAAIVSVRSGGPLLGSRELYLEPAYAPIREAYQAHIARLLAIAGFDRAEERARNVLAIDTKIAELTWSAAELRDDMKKNNVVSLDELAARAPGFDWPAYVAATGVGTPARVNMTTPSSIAAMVDLIASEPVESWKDYMRYATVVGTSRYLPKAARDEVFDFLGRRLTGAQEPQARWIEALLDLGGQGRPLADALSRLYVARYVPADARPKLKAMVDNILAAFDARLKDVEWMAPQTREEARAKLAKVMIKVIYPEVWRDVGGLEVVRGDPVGNARRAAAWLRADELSWLTSFPDKRLFFQPVYLVNAYANTAWNEIVFLAAIVRPPAFDPAADPAVNYGAMGAIIGHEISHLFDDKGRATDGDGILRDWWTEADAERFTAATKRLEAQVGAYEPLPGKRVNGALTLGESIADLAGLVVAHDAYLRSLEGKPAPVLDGFTGDQRFFLAFAQAWRWKGRDAAVERMMQTDEHPPSAVRPNTVRNVDAWYDAFDVEPGDALYLPPEERVKLW